MKNKLDIEDIEGRIADEEYINPSVNPAMTICVLLLQNGFTVTGTSCPIDPENFDKEVGKDVARGKALDSIWMLEGYLAKEAISPR